VEKLVDKRVGFFEYLVQEEHLESRTMGTHLVIFITVMRAATPAPIRR